jgi:guanyl-specific ribonuclease Sa
MKALLALPFAFAFACASPSSSSNPGSATAANGQSCGADLPAIVYRNSQIFAGPDSSHTVLATVNQDTPVCASRDSQAFGFRKVKLSNGSTGYVADSSLSI